MPNSTDLAATSSKSNLPQTQNPNEGLRAFLSRDVVKARLEEVLKDRAPQFSASILSLVNAKAELLRCAPDSIVGAAMIAASLDLPINPNLGFAHIVPYKGRAQFQMGYKGFVQLGMRTGQYRYLNACPVCEGELVEYNKLSGRVVID